VAANMIDTAEQVWGTLTHHGHLWNYDFIGETQGQYDPKRLDILKRLLSVCLKNFARTKSMAGCDPEGPGNCRSRRSHSGSGTLVWDQQIY
jgi:hypothetical protein